MGALLLAAGAVLLLAIPGYYHREPAAVALAVGGLLVLAGYLVVPQTNAGV